MATTPLTALGQLQGCTDENGAVVIVPVAGGLNPSAPTIMPNLQGRTDDQRALQVVQVTAGAQRTRARALGTLKLKTDDQGSVVVANGTAGAARTPLTPLALLQCVLDENGALVVAPATLGALRTPVTSLLNLRGRTDENGALLVAGVSLVSVYQTRILADDAKAYWPLDDPAGSLAARDMAGPRDAVISGAVTLNQVGVGAARAMLFGATGIMRPPSFPLKALSFTFEAWVNRTGGSGQLVLMSRDFLTDGDFQWVYRTDVGSGAFRLVFVQGTIQTVDFPMALPLGQWTHIVLVCSGTVAVLYIDGLASAPQALLTGSNGLGAPALANFDDAPSLGWIGLLQDMAIYQRVLTGTEILAHYNLRTDAPALVSHLMAFSPDANGFTSGAINTVGATLIAVFVEGANDAPTLTDAFGNLYTGLTAYTNATLVGRWFYKLSPVTGAGHTFTVTGTFKSIFALAFNAPTITEHAEVGATSSSNTASLSPGTLTPAAGRELFLVGASVGNGGGVVSIDNGFAVVDSRNTSATAYGGAVAYVVSDVPVTPTWAFSGLPTFSVAAMVGFR